MRISDWGSDVCSSDLPNIKLLLAMMGVVKNERPDIVHCVTHKAAIFGSIAARVCGVNRIVLTVTGLGSVFVSNTVRNILLRLVLRFQYWIAARFAHAVFFQNQIGRAHV